MKKYWLLGLILFLVSGIVVAQSGISLPENLQGKIPWDLEGLGKAPEYKWIDRTDSVWSITYTGEFYKGKETEVFAYFASPATLGVSSSNEGKFPGIVLVHGGGGTAFRIWALEWANKGYAAIAMDLSGNVPSAEQDNPWGAKGNRMEAGGPKQDDVHKFFRMDEPFTEQWQFHSVSNIILAHSLIRSFPDVSPEKTAITGISWGGYLTNLVAGVDHRFAAAVPVYGAGFLHEGSAWDSQFDSLGIDGTKRWVELWDPSSYVANATMPMLFVNGTNDFAYFVENWQCTANLAKDAQFSMIPELKHSHLHGAEPREIYNFISQQLENKSEFLSSIRFKQKGSKAKYKIVNATEVYLAYTTDSKRSPEREWKLVSLEKSSGTVSVPTESKASYIYWVDKWGNRRSGEVMGFE
ncbi:alpha/beta hydrolase family protein [Lunatibacter salilacus]|uniref:alpha/beta hydrolase family protein n=1 Tax=Lunatibacter salilacus TaxID=2483804 RepID=UPI00131DB90D|nr:prolyl oligopeptidase family serine peptidase [Lunatibacter salilacus]